MLPGKFKRMLLHGCFGRDVVHGQCARMVDTDVLEGRFDKDR